jgi:CubicO group peptidase (beta-lactamase class C family)
MFHGGKDGWYGWFGLGGSVMQWHPEYKIGFGYTTANFYMADTYNYRVSEMQKLVVDIA